MQIDFTKEQYLDLLKLVYCGDTMINWSNKNRNIEIDELTSYIYSFAKGFWCERYVNHNKDDKIYTASLELEENEEVNSYVEAYNTDKDDEAFWEELIQALAERDIEEKNKNPKELETLAEFYDQEFVKNGVKNLRVVK